MNAVPIPAVDQSASMQATVTGFADRLNELRADPRWARAITPGVLVEAIATVADELKLATGEGAHRRAFGQLGAELVLLGAELAITCSDNLVGELEDAIEARERCVQAL